MADHPDDTLLESARMSASTDWEEGFVADLLKRRREWGGAFELTDNQRLKLMEISGEIE